MLPALLGPAEPEVGCDACFDELDRYVELTVAGADADAAVPGLRAHLAGCPACREEFESLRDTGRRRRRGRLMSDARPPLPPFDDASARQKVLAAEEAWNTRDPQRVALAYTEDSEWRNRDEFLRGRDEIVAFLTRKWQRELDYALRKDLWAFGRRSHRRAVPVRVARRVRRVVAGRTATSTGSSRHGRCAAARRASTTSPSPPPTGASSARAPTATRPPRRCADRRRRPGSAGRDPERRRQLQ